MAPRRGPVTAFSGADPASLHGQRDAHVLRCGTGSWRHPLASYGILPDEPHEIARGYTMQCAVSMTSRDLAAMGATLANGGVQPATGERVLDEDVVRQTLSVMLGCGMYDASGQWIAEVGLPAESGVSGGVLAVVPSLMGIAAYSPRLDDNGNSVRGLESCERLSESWRLHLLRHG